MSGTLARAGEVRVIAFNELLVRGLMAFAFATILTCVAIAAFALADGKTATASQAGGAAGLAAVAALLAPRFRGATGPLRILEALVGAALLAALLVQGLGSEAPDAWLRTTLYTVVAIMAYGVLIPQSVGRAALTIAVATGASAAAILYLHSQTTGDDLPVGTLIVLVIGGLIALAGSALVTLFREVAVNTRVDNMYNLFGRIGAGGMGEVWRAEHQRLARPAAIKLIRPDMLGGDEERADRLREQFEREARVTARLRSPYTIQVYDVGSTDNGTFYYVMEFLEGLDIESLIREYGPQGAPRTIHLLKQVCQSLADAHDNGLVHRDIKPANIFLSHMGGTFDHAKVLDFGLAKPADESDESGQLTGTPAYLPPESITGEKPVGPASDIYSLGCVAYFMLTGELVFDDTDLVKVAAAHVDRQPIKPSLRTELPIPEDLEALVLRCLSKDPADRPATGAALLAELAAIDREPWTQEDARSWWQTHGLASKSAA